MPTILLTGAAGFIGRAVRRQAVIAEIDCVGLDRQASPPEAKAGSGSSDPILGYDLTDAASLNALLASRDFNAIIHLAGVLPGAASKDPIRATQVNIGGSLALFEGALNHRISRFIFASSTSVYGAAAMNTPISELVPAAPIDAYGAAKRAIEIVGENLSSNGGIEFVSLRMATVIGPGARNTSSPWRSEIFEKLGTQQRIRLPYQSDDQLTIVEVDDVARMLITLLTTKSISHSIYNTPAELLTVGELKRAVETTAPQTQIELIGRTRPLAPLADGSRFTREFKFETTRFEDSLRAALSQRRKQI